MIGILKYISNYTPPATAGKPDYRQAGLCSKYTSARSRLRPCWLVDYGGQAREKGDWLVHFTQCSQYEHDRDTGGKRETDYTHK